MLHFTLSVNILFSAQHPIFSNKIDLIQATSVSISTRSVSWNKVKLQWNALWFGSKLKTYASKSVRVNRAKITLWYFIIISDDSPMITSITKMLFPVGLMSLFHSRYRSILSNTSSDPKKSSICVFIAFTIVHFWETAWNFWSLIREFSFIYFPRFEYNFKK